MRVSIFSNVFSVGFLLGCILGLPNAYAQNEASENALGNTTKISVIDFRNRAVKLDKPAKRIVALAPHIVENMFAAGAGDALVGVVDYSDFPEPAKKIPRVGAISAASVEAILALSPDLVVVWESGGAAKILPKLESLGLKVYVSNPKALEDIARSIVDFGVLTGHQQSASSAAKNYLLELESLKKQFANKRIISVLYQVWYQPLQTLNDDHVISDVIRLCGGKNSFGDAVTLAPKIAIESVIVRNPDVIIASGMGDSRPDWLDNWKAWPSLSAVRNGFLFFIPPDIIQRHSPRILQGAAMMCKHLDAVRVSAKYGR